MKLAPISSPRYTGLRESVATCLASSVPSFMAPDSCRKGCLGAEKGWQGTGLIRDIYLLPRGIPLRFGLWSEKPSWEEQWTDRYPVSADC